MSEIPTCIAVRPSVFRSGLVQVLEEAERTRPSLLDEEALYEEQEHDAANTGGCDVVVLDASGREWGPLLAKLERGGVRPKRVLLVEEVRSAPHAADLLALNVAGCVRATETPESLVAKVIATAEGDWRRSRADLFDAIRQVQEPNAEGVPLSHHCLGTLTLVARGLSNRRIAEELNLAEGTVRNRVSALYEEIRVTSRGEAILWAWRHGIGSHRRDDAARS